MPLGGPPSPSRLGVFWAVQGAQSLGRTLLQPFQLTEQQSLATLRQPNIVWISLHLLDEEGKARKSLFSGAGEGSGEITVELSQCRIT